MDDVILYRMKTGMRNFEVFTARFVAVSQTASVSVSKRGIIGFNQKVFAALGEPKCVVLLFDRSSHTAGVRKAACAEPYAYPVCSQPNGRSYRINARAFCNAYSFGPTGDAPLIFTPTIEEGVLILEVNSATVGYFRVRNAKGRGKHGTTT